MAKGYPLERTVLFIAGVVFFALITLRMMSSSVSAPGTSEASNQSSMYIHKPSSSSNISKSTNSWGAFGMPSISSMIEGLSSTSEVLPMTSVGLIQLQPQSTLTMESTGMYKIEAVGKLKMDSTGRVSLEPVGDIKVIQIGRSEGSPKTNDSLSYQTAINHFLPAAPRVSSDVNSQIDSFNLSPQYSKIIEQFKKPLAQQPTKLESPGPGTDILTNPRQLLELSNQSQAIIPKLDLQHDFKIYFCKHLGHGVRFYYLSREAWLLHPRIHMVEHPDQAQYVIYLPTSSPWHKTECNNPSYRNKTIVLDEGDGPGLFEVQDNVPGKWFLYFKRSFVSRHRGIFQGFMKYVNHGEVFPMTYTVAEAYIKLQYNQFINRDLEILCTLRGSNHDPVRLRVREWVEEYIRARGIKNAIAGQINQASRTVISKEYFSNMYRSKIIVTSNPSGWEGDFRFCEALSSGALIFIDHMYVPRPDPFVHNKHIVYYDNNNKTDLFDKLDYFREQRKLTADIAMAGYLHAMKYHRASNFADYVFKTVQTKISQLMKPGLRGNEVGLYEQTGYDMLKIAQANAKKTRIL